MESCQSSLAMLTTAPICLSVPKQLSMGNATIKRMTITQKHLLTITSRLQVVAALLLFGIVGLNHASSGQSRQLDNRLPQSQQLSRIRHYYVDGQFQKVLAEYPGLPADLHDNPQVYFYVGQSYLRERDIEHAEEFLLKSDKKGLSKQQAERATAALARIAILKQLRPPILSEHALDGYRIRVFARDTPWSRNLIKQMPVFLARAKEAFGNENCFVNFYLFEDHPSYDRFFDSWTGEPKNELHRGTGCMHTVLYCRYFPSGREVGIGNINDLYFRVLHEYGHALCNTLYGDRFRMPQWLDEGMADYFGWRFKPNGAELSSKKLQGIAERTPAVTLESLSKRLHEDNELGYAVSDVLVTRLFQDKPISIYRQIIEKARASDPNFNDVVMQVTGRDPQLVYEQILKAYWSK